jgi:hypothetical protein
MSQADQTQRQSPESRTPETQTSETPVSTEDIKNQQDPSSNAQKDPDHWVTGGEPATGAQRSYLQTLAEEASESVPDDLNKAEASKKIDELQDKTGRGN